MELDVHLTRENEEPWGFEIVEDIGIPLTIDKVYPSSPAHSAGLQPGDLITRVGDRLTTDLTLDAALDIIADAIGSLSLGVTRGLYDPVLDDYEPIYESVDPVDFDRRSATEVFEPQAFIEPSDLTPKLYQTLDSNGLLDINGTLDSFRPLNLSSSQTPQDFSFSRSLTGSPFAPNKVYRPFSTEPLEVPPLEDPIILNPDFKDEFEKFDENGNEIKIETVFKLPVSEQYDPNWSKKVTELLENIGKEKFGKKTDIQKHNVVEVVETTKTELISETIEVTERKTEEVVQKIERDTKEVISKDIKTDESDKFEQTEIDLKKIEQTAIDVVEESIERAVSVTEEIQKEVEEELRASMTREIDSTVTDYKETKQLNITQESLGKIEKEAQQELNIEESIENIDMKSNMVEYSKESIEQNKIELSRNEISFEDKCRLEEKNTKNTNKNLDIQNEKEIREEFIELKESTKKSEFINESNSEFQTNRESKQMAYKMGLQTIPNIRGMVQSSHHFDLLLRTFFIHLTDVMVALSMFILTQPAAELDKKAETIINEKLVSGFEQKVHSESNAKTASKVNKEQSRQKNDTVTHNKVKINEERKVESKTVDKKQAKEQIAKVEREERVVKQNGYLSEQEAIEMKKLSGSELAQLQQRKSNELMQKMDSVITEFETKSGIEETEERRRSRSRSRIEEEVMNESDPLEWLDKVNKSVSKSESQHTQEKSIITSKTVTSESKTTKKSKADKQMYIATVESHVYTNKDAILEEQLSPTLSIQSTEEVNSALEVIDKFNQNVAVKTSFAGAEKKQAVEVITNALEDVLQEKQETVAEFDFKKTEEKVSKSVKDDFKVIATAESVQASTELKHEELDLKETKIQKASVTSEESLQTDVKATEVSLESTKELIDSRITLHQASAKQESLSKVSSESSEILSQSDVKIFETKSVTDSKALVTSVEDYKTATVESIEVALEATEEVTEQKVSKMEVSKQEILTTIASEATEVIAQEASIKSLETYEATSKTAVVTTEDSFKATAVQSETALEEMNVEISELRTIDSKASTKVEPLSIAVAETTNIAADDKVETFESEKIETKTASMKTEGNYKAVAVETTEVALEAAEEEHTVNLEKEALIREDTRHLAVARITETKVEQDKIKTQTYDEQNAALKIVKEQLIEVDNSVNITESEVNIEKSSLITDIKSSEEITILSNKKPKLRLRTETNENGDLLETPTPSTLPPTPLTDEYVFKLTIPLPKDRGTTPIPNDSINESPDEDPHIVKKNLIPHIDSKIEDQILYDPPLQSPVSDKSQPVYIKPGLRGGAAVPYRKEYIREIERKSSLLASAIDETIKSIEEYKVEAGIDGKTDKQEEIIKPIDKTDEKDGELDATDELVGFRTVQFNPEQNNDKKNVPVQFQVNIEGRESKLYTDATGEPLGTERGIVDGLEDATVNDDIAKEIGKPGMTEEKIAELISGESEMLREAHVMGLSRVLSSHMHRPDDSVDFQKIKPLVDSLNNSEVLKALNEELKKKQEEKKQKDEKKWTTFLQKPKRPVPSAKFGYHGYIEQEIVDKEPYKVKIVKQPKPKVAPDYKPEDFDTGPLPWEERALNEPSPPPVEPEDPILIPEGTPEFLEAVDPLPESEVPDLEDTGIPLPPPRQLTTPEAPKEDTPPIEEEEGEKEEVVEEDNKTEEKRDEMSAPEQGADKLVECVRNMVDPNAPLEQQLNVMRAQLAALAQLPCVIQQSLDMLTRQLMNLQQTETTQVQQSTTECKMIEEYHEQREETIKESNEVLDNENVTIEEMLPSIEEGKEDNSPVSEDDKHLIVKSGEELNVVKSEEEIEQDEKQRKEKQEMRLEQESRQVKQRSAPRVGKPRPAFGPLHPEERPLVLPGGRRWRGPKDAMNDQMIAETLQGQAEIIQGKVMGINFMKYEKPPVNLDHLQNSETYKLVHNMDKPRKRVELLTPVVAEADYRERCRSVTPHQKIGPQ